MYVVGGGNYIEYQNLQDYCKRQQNSKRVTYGTSQLMNAKQFLIQVHILNHFVENAGGLLLFISFHAVVRTGSELVIVYRLIREKNFKSKKIIKRPT